MSPALVACVGLAVVVTLAVGFNLGGRKVDPIRAYREQYPEVGLREAKEHVDGLCQGPDKSGRRDRRSVDSAVALCELC